MPVVVAPHRCGQEAGGHDEHETERTDTEGTQGRAHLLPGREPLHGDGHRDHTRHAHRDARPRDLRARDRVGVEELQDRERHEEAEREPHRRSGGGEQRECGQHRDRGQPRAEAAGHHQTEHDQAREAEGGVEDTTPGRVPARRAPPGARAPRTRRTR